MSHILLDKAVVLIARQMFDVREVAGDQVIDRDNPMIFGQQSVRQMRAKKPCAAGDHGNRMGDARHNRLCK